MNVTDGDDGRVQMYNCRHALCRKLILLKEPNDPDTEGWKV